MMRVYSIEVDCVNCAALMEEGVQKLDGIIDVSVNFMTQKMVVEFENDYEEKTIIREINKVCRKIEPEFFIED